MLPVAKEVYSFSLTLLSLFLSILVMWACIASMSVLSIKPSSFISHRWNAAALLAAPVAKEVYSFSLTLLSLFLSILVMWACIASMSVLSIKPSSFISHRWNAAAVLAPPVANEVYSFSLTLLSLFLSILVMWACIASMSVLSIKPS